MSTERVPINVLLRGGLPSSICSKAGKAMTARARESPPPQSTFWPIPLHPLPLYKCVSADRRISRRSREEARRCTER